MSFVFYFEVLFCFFVSTDFSSPKLPFVVSVSPRLSYLVMPSRHSLPQPKILVIHCECRAHRSKTHQTVKAVVLEKILWAQSGLIVLQRGELQSTRGCQRVTGSRSLMSTRYRCSRRSNGVRSILLHSSRCVNVLGVMNSFVDLNCQ